MSNLILTPIHVRSEEAKLMLDRVVDAIDKHSKFPYLHILIDDNSNSVDLRNYISNRRRAIKIFSDYGGIDHKNQLGQAIQLGYEYAKQRFCNEKLNNNIENVFFIESDVIVKDSWDFKMISEAELLTEKVGREHWYTLDCLSVDESGAVTYPTQGNTKPGFSIIKYAEFQCTLLNRHLRLLESVSLSDIPSHFDILWSREIEDKIGRAMFYSTPNVEVIHYPHTSRKIYMKS